MTSFVTFISSTDPPAFVAVTLLLVMIALWACYVPARRAMRMGIRLNRKPNIRKPRLLSSTLQKPGKPPQTP
jgi:hypothetical protein